MRKVWKFAILFLGAVSAVAQVPAPPTAMPTQSPESPNPWSKTFSSDADFTYAYPSDWEEVDSKPLAPAARLRAQDSAGSDVERQAAGCTEIQLVIRHGLPRSVIVVVVMPYSCMKNQMKQSDLVGVASGIAAGLQKSFILTEPNYTAYKMGGVEFWAERAKGSPKAHPERTQTVETTCGMLKKALACWMGFFSSEEDLHTFESGAITIANGKPAPLISSDAFEEKKRR